MVQSFPGKKKLAKDLFISTESGFFLIKSLFSNTQGKKVLEKFPFYLSFSFTLSFWGIRERSGAAFVQGF